MSKNKFKKFVKLKIRDAAYKYLQKEKESKSKVKNIQYKKYKLQNYLKSNLFSNFSTEILFRLRSQNIEVKANFKSKYKVNNVINLQCRMDNCYEIEDQQHLLKCKPILRKLTKKSALIDIKYNDLFSNTKKQKKVVDLFIELLDIRNTILEE